VYFQSSANEAYYINVYGFKGVSGSFGITIFETDAPPHECENAISLDLDEITEVVFQNNNTPCCFYLYREQDSGQQYSLFTSISLYNGFCGNSEKIDLNYDGGCGDGKLTVVFQSVANETYNAYVD